MKRKYFPQLVVAGLALAGIALEPVPAEPVQKGPGKTTTRDKADGRLKGAAIVQKELIAAPLPKPRRLSEQDEQVLIRYGQ